MGGSRTWKLALKALLCPRVDTQDHTEALVLDITLHHLLPPFIASHHSIHRCTILQLLCVGSHMPPFYCSAPQPEQYIVLKCTDGACFVSFVVFQSFLQVPHFCRLASLKGDKLRPCWGNNCIVECIPSKCDIDDCVGKDHWKGKYLWV